MKVDNTTLLRDILQSLVGQEITVLTVGNQTLYGTLEDFNSFIIHLSGPSPANVDVYILNAHVTAITPGSDGDGYNG